MTIQRIFVSTCIFGLAAAFAAGCATSGGESEQPQHMLKPTISYEDIDAGPAQAQAATDGGAATAQAATPVQPAAPADPFDGCMAKQVQKGIASLDCGTTDAMIVNVVGKLTPQQVDQNFAAYAQNFKGGKEEKYTREFKDKTAQAVRITGANYVASMLIVPHGSKHTRVIACRVQQSTDWSRCHAITQMLVDEGIPAKVTGADQLPHYFVARPKPAKQEEMQADGGAMAPGAMGDGGAAAEPMAMDGGAAH